MTKSTKKLQAVEYFSKAMVLVATAPRDTNKYWDALQDLQFISRSLSTNEIKDIKEYLINRATKENAPTITIDNLKNLFPFLDSF
tara:strand:+ start:770 stop:1024 length:255 start_codon:yes stop_codon:yes gene_type:complete